MLGTSQTSESNPLLVGDDMWHCNMFTVGWGHYQSLFICTTTTLLNYRQHGGEERKVLVAEDQPTLHPAPPILYFLVRWCKLYSPHFFPAPPASQPEVLYAHQENLPQLIGPFQWSEPSIKWILMSPRFTMHYNAPTIGHNWQWLRKSATL